MLDAVAVFVCRRARGLLVGFLVLVAAAGAVGGPVVGLLDADDNFDDPAAEAIQARDALRDAAGASPGADLVALVRLRAPVGSDRADEKLERVESILAGEPGVAFVAAPADPRPGGDMVSDDGRTAYLTASFRAGADRSDTARALQRRLQEEPGVLVGGSVIAQEQVAEQISRDLQRAELLAFPILFGLLLMVFRGAVAALLPLAVGMTSILFTFALIRLVNAVEPMSVFAVNVITGLGLGLAIDYSLFMVSRFREELQGGAPTDVALRATMSTAGRTVLFSALTVAAALAALVVFRQRFLFSMGIGGALVALAAAAVSLTLLPALMAVLGRRVNALSPRRWKRAVERDASRLQEGFWYRLSQAVMRRPGPVAAAAAVLLITIGLPFTRIEFTGADASVLPPEQSARAVSDALTEEFAGRGGPPVYVAVRGGEEDRPLVEDYAQRLAALPGALAVIPPAAPQEGLWRIDVIPRGAMLDDVSRELVSDVRRAPAPFDEVLVGGATANFVDQQASLADHLPAALALVCATTLAILFLMTGSVVLPVKTLLMNLLTVSAAFGLLVLVFQDGRLEGLLDYTSQGAIESSQPILLFAIAFGLSTDYGVFLLTRIKEARDSGLPDREAVAVGLERTGRIITFAALLFCIAIGAFATSEIIFIKQVGLGTAAAVLIDATLVRALLVPSLMALLGRWNWWAPAPLRRVHERFGVAEAGPALGGGSR